MSRPRFGKLMPSAETYEKCRVYDAGKMRVIFTYEVDVTGKTKDKLVQISLYDEEGDLLVEGEPREMLLASAALAASLDSELGA